MLKRKTYWKSQLIEFGHIASCNWNICIISLNRKYNGRISCTTVRHCAAFFNFHFNVRVIIRTDKNTHTRTHTHYLVVSFGLLDGRRLHFNAIHFSFRLNSHQFYGTLILNNTEKYINIYLKLCFSVVVRKNIFFKKSRFQFKG